MPRLLFTIFFFVLVQISQAQINIDFPVERSVFQRGNDNFGYIAINGTSSEKMDSLVAQFQSDTTITNKALVNTTAKGYFQERVKMPGGWYKLTVLGYKNGIVKSQKTIQKVGVGEVYIICGQSNAQGKVDFGARGAQDDRVNSVNYYNENLSFTPPDRLEISKIEDNSDIAPYGKSPWCWGELGDMIAAKYDVPVLFFNAAWQATFSSNWSDSRDEIPAFDILTFGTLPVGYPYHHLDMSHKYYASLFGVRAVLWHLGETDTNPGIPRPGEYYKYIKYTIEKSREDFGFNVPWMISEVSFSAGATSEVVLNDQRDLVKTPGLNAFTGPYTDPVMQPRVDGTHFGNTSTQNGLTDLAQAWFEKIDGGFLDESNPILTNPLAELSIECNNDGLTIKTKSDQSIYQWSDNSNEDSKTAKSGQFSAIVFDSLLNYKIGTSIDISGIKFESNPTITSLSDSLCAGDSLLISSSEQFDSILWNNGNENHSFYINDNAELAFEVYNSYGCKIGNSPAKVYNKIEIPAFAINPTFEISDGTFDSTSHSIVTCTGRVVEIEANGAWNEFSWNGEVANSQVTLTSDTIVQFAGKYNGACPSIETEPFIVSFIDHPEPPQIVLEDPYTLRIANAADYSSNVVFEWQGGPPTLNDTDPIYKPASPGIYSNRAVLYFDDGDGCGSPLSNEIDFKIDPNKEIIVVYPNPTPNQVSIAASKTQKSVNIAVYNAIGKIVRSVDMAIWNGDAIDIDLNALAPGYYNIIVDSSENHMVKKIFKY
ncbi:Por secretion system C-terminal sorting domain-containing protein [Spirosomataceae bacterium TFI 002]|nr:Por secretion system C-terminal sorting domain-containing protein [Spirosomataceae bacterium TFI 002]